jgi:hypothetical protein
MSFIRDYIRNLFHKGYSTIRPHDKAKFLDEGFLASWDLHAGERISKITKAARLGYLDDITASKYFDDINDSIRRTWNDQTLQPQQIAPIEASYKYDKITDYGLSLFCSLIVGKSVPYISHMGIGDGSGATYDYQDTLYAEKVRYAFGDEGYINSLGRTLRFHMTYDIMLASATYTEIGLFNNPNIGVGPLVARSTFDPGVIHTSGFNYITGSYLISTLSA